MVKEVRITTVMKFMKNWDYNIKCLWRKKFDVVKNVAAFIGTITSVYKMFEIMDLKSAIEFVSGINICTWILVILISFAYNIYKEWPTNKQSFIVKNVKGEITVTLCCGDIFTNNETIVIPVNSTFDTSFHNEIISPNSVQGQFQNLYFKDDITELDKIINNSLIAHGMTGKDLERKDPMKNICYDLGTIAEINYNDKGKKRRAYFLASSNTNKYSKVEHVYMKDYMFMLSRFWENMSKYGHTEENIAMPILCSGKAGMSESLDTLVAEIVNSYITISREYVLTRNLTIYVHPDDLKNRQILFEKLVKHVEAICDYK